MFKFKLRKAKAISWRWVAVWILIALLLLALYLLLKEYGDLTYAFARHRAESGDTIQGLQDTVQSLKTANAGLTNANADLTMQVQELTVKINGQEVVSQAPTVVNVPSGLEKPTQLFSPATTAPIIITTLVTLFNGIRTLLPVLP